MDSSDDEAFKLASRRVPARKRPRARALHDSDDECHDEHLSSVFKLRGLEVVYRGNQHDIWELHERLCRLRAGTAFQADQQILGLMLYRRKHKSVTQVF